MQAAYVNPFILNALQVMRKTVRVQADQGKATLHTGQCASQQDVGVAIGLVGQVRGAVQLRMGEETACRVASNMLMGLSVPEMDDMAHSALMELVNIIAGNATIDLASSGYKCDITPPMVVRQEEDSPGPSPKTLVVPINSELGEIRLAINAVH